MPNLPPLSPWTKVAYGIGSFCEAIKTFVFGIFLLFFYTSVMGLSGTLVALATAIGLGWDSTIDPLIGYWSDRARVRFGRRHAFMFAGSALMGVSFFAIFNPPVNQGAAFLFAWLVVTSLLLRTTNSIFQVPYFALGAELDSDYNGRTSVSAIRAGFGLFGTMMAAAVAFTLFFPETAGLADPKFNRDGFFWMALWFGGAITAAGLVATFGTLSARARVAAAPRPPGSLAAPRLVGGIRLALADRDFRILVASTALFFLASVINAALAIQYVTHYAEIPQSSSMSVFLFAFYAGAIAGVPVWLRLAKRVDKHRLYSTATLATATVLIGAYWVIGEGSLFGTNNLPVLACGNALAGWFGSATWVLVPSMIADVAGHDELRTGQRREGTFFGIYSLTHQASAGLAILATGLGLDHFAGLVPGQFEQSAETVRRVGLLFSVLPAALMIMSALLIRAYGLTRLRVQSIQQELSGEEGPDIVRAGRGPATRVAPRRADISGASASPSVDRPSLV